MPPTRSLLAGLVVLLVSPLLAGCLAGDSAPLGSGGLLPVGGALRTTVPGIVDPEGGGGEPSILVAPDGTIFIAAPLGSSRARADALWVSTDGGATFAHAGTPTYPFGGGDTDLAMDDAGTLYMPGQWGARAYVGGTPVAPVTGPAVGYPFPVCESMAVSKDMGKSWILNPVACGLVGAVDRQWVDTVGTGTVYMAFNQIPGGLAVVKSTDSGLTWTPLKLPGEGLSGEFSARGNLATDKKDGTIYVAHASGSGPAVWVSDGFSEFTLKVAHETTNEVQYIFNVVAVGTDGSVHLVWSEDTGDEVAVFLASSTDKGDTWTAPVKVNRARGVAVFPWVAAGDAGRVAVAWYGTDRPGLPDHMEDDAEWHAHLAVTTNALDSQPVFDEARVTEKPIHHGVLCTSGSGCDPNNRRLLDFFEIAIGPDGRVHMVVTDDTEAEPTTRVRNLFVKQTGGPLLVAAPPSGEA